jgi:hypothetical protein
MLMPKKKAGQRTQKNRKTIQIRVQGEDITVEPTAAHLAVGDAIEWHLDGEDGAMLLTFTDGEVVGGTKLRAAPGRPASARAAKRGVFHYQVAVYVDGEIHADVGCPTIIIE